MIAHERVEELVKPLFNEHLDEHGLDTEQAESVTIKDFAVWVKESFIIDRMADEMVEEPPKGVGADPREIDSLRMIFDDPFMTCQVLFPLWDAIRLAGRPPVRIAPHRLGLVLGAYYPETDKAWQVQTSGMMSGKARITDGRVMAIFQQMFRTALQELGTAGLNKLAEAALSPAGQEEAAPPGNTAKKPKIWFPGCDS